MKDEMKLTVMKQGGQENEEFWLNVSREKGEPEKNSKNVYLTTPTPRLEFGNACIAGATH